MPILVANIRTLAHWFVMAPHRDELIPTRASLIQRLKNWTASRCGAFGYANVRPLVGYCELCGRFTIAPVPSAFFYEFDGSRFPVCVECAVNYGVRISPSVVQS